MSLKQCTKCGIWKAPEEFEPLSRTPWRRTGDCRECRNRRRRERRAGPRNPSRREAEAKYKSAWLRAKRAERRSGGLCPRCGRVPPVGNIYCCHDRPSAATRKQIRSAQVKLRARVLAAYGGPCCACCGETTVEFLQIDHINQDGAAHRRSLGIASGTAFYCWLQRNGFPPGYQVLCANCNFARGRHGTCPHERARQLQRKEVS